jgi:hypothetical protein
MFKSDVSSNHCEYALGILTKQCQFFGPFSVSYQEIARPSTLNILMRSHGGQAFSYSVAPFWKEE